LTGVKQKSGRLTAIKCVGFEEKFRHARWECRCECGNVTVVSRGAFLDGTTKSCGCWKEEHDNSRFGESNPNYKDGRFARQVA
jgi:hypothetical protein